jgi:hypothetical protein
MLRQIPPHYHTQSRRHVSWHNRLHGDTITEVEDLGLAFMQAYRPSYSNENVDVTRWANGLHGN